MIFIKNFLNNEKIQNFSFSIEYINHFHDIIEYTCKIHNLKFKASFQKIKTNTRLCPECYKDKLEKEKIKKIKSKLPDKITLISLKDKKFNCNIHGTFFSNYTGNLKNICKKCYEEDKSKFDIYIKNDKFYCKIHHCEVNKRYGCKICLKNKEYYHKFYLPESIKEFSKNNYKCKNGHKFFFEISYPPQKIKCEECMDKTIKQKFINKMNKQNKFKILFEKYYNFKTNIPIICKEHGMFFSRPISLVNKITCPHCRPEKINIMTEETLKKKELKFIQKSKEIHKNKYSYEMVSYKNNISKVLIKCKKHGYFEQSPMNHLTGSGCQKCSKTFSKEENYIKEFIGGISSKKIIYPYELDVYSKKYNFAVEYNGLLWHSEGNTFPVKKNMKNYHLRKTELCEEKGIQLFHIFEDEWLDPVKKQIWISVLKNKMNQSKRIDSQKCILKEINSKESKEFLENNHLQGSCNSSIKIGLFYNDELVQVMTIGKHKEFNYEIIRIASKLNISVVNGVSKILRYFEDKYKPESIISYANRRWSVGNLYKQLGFELKNISEPNYFYVKGSKLESRNKNVLDNFNEKLTEKENMFNNGYRRIFDSGNLVFVKKIK